MSVTVWTEPRITVLAVTHPYWDEMHNLLIPFENAEQEDPVHADDARSSEYIPVFAGRACYQSFGDKAGRKSAKEYLGHIIESQHFSVLEHASVTFYIEGVSRSLTHELVRHRHLSFSQLSQRYVDHSDELGIVIPPKYDNGVASRQVFYSFGLEIQSYYAALLRRLDTADDLTIKQRREIARALLPNCTETKIVVTGNLRAWLEVLEKRDSPHADAEFQRLAKLLRSYLEEIAPNVFSK